MMVAARSVSKNTKLGYLKWKKRKLRLEIESPN